MKDFGGGGEVSPSSKIEAVHNSRLTIDFVGTDGCVLREQFSRLFGLKTYSVPPKLRMIARAVFYVCNSPRINPAFTSRAHQIKESVKL